MKESIYIVEDMAMVRAALIQSLEENNFIIAGSAASAEKAWQELKNIDVDILLLDINLMGEHDGIWLAKNIRGEFNLPIVFLTAYGDKKTLNQLNELHPNGYLMKPYNEPTLLTTISIALNSFYNSQKQGNCTSEIFIKNNGLQVKLYTEKILYIKSDGNYIDIHLKQTRYTVRSKLMSFLKSIQHSSIIRVHQRYAINIAHIKAISNNTVFLPSISIPVSKKYQDNLTSILD